MASGVNKQILIGNIGKIDARTTSGGTCVVNMSVATSMKVKDRQGNFVEETTWHNVVCFGKLAEVIRDYCSKGKKVYVEGPTKHESYEKDGQTRYITKVIANQIQLLSPKDEGASAPSDNYSKKDDVPFDDSIPF